MAHLRRNEITWNERFRRCLYFFLRDELDTLLLKESLIVSYNLFKESGREYPFVEKRELKPRARVYGPEYQLQNHFIVIFNEDSLPPSSKNHIRFLESNKLTKENLGAMAVFDLQEIFHQRMRFFNDPSFKEVLTSLLDTDFAVLLQRDPTVKARYRFGISHFHVKIDWPVADAAQDLGRQLRYISKDLYEKGDRCAETLQQKLYEYYGLHHTVGGRRTAALVAAQYMERFDFISTVYVSSSEARTLLRISEQGISKYALIKLDNKEIQELCKYRDIGKKEFADSYLIDSGPDWGVGIFLVTYKHNEYSRPPADGRLRELNPEYQWLNVDVQLIIPPPDRGDVRPIAYPKIYS
jgi:hypothetical protein